MKPVAAKIEGLAGRHLFGVGAPADSVRSLEQDKAQAFHPGSPRRRKARRTGAYDHHVDIR